MHCFISVQLLFFLSAKSLIFSYPYPNWMLVLVLNRWTAYDGFFNEHFSLLPTEKINELFEWSATGSFSKNSFLPLFVYLCESGLNPPLSSPSSSQTISLNFISYNKFQRTISLKSYARSHERLSLHFWFSLLEIKAPPMYYDLPDF